MKKGYVSLVLHSHLPFVRHPEEEHFLEENWLYEAITESYLPLLDVFQRLERDRVKFRVNMSITPPLANMLSDPLLIERYDRYIGSRIALLEKLIAEEKDASRRKALIFYFERLLYLYDLFSEKFSFDIIGAFRYFFERGFVELLTCTATHEILPLEQNRKIREVQVRVGVESFARHFGKKPRGIWLGECAYTSGVDQILSQNGIEYTILDTHGILFSNPSPVFGISAPVVSRSGLVFFGRDPNASKQVWSAQEGYPGDFNYREFYRDIGYDIEESDVKEFLHPGGFRFDSGIKIHKITGKVPLSEKRVYEPDVAFAKAEEHAGNFMFNLEREAEHLYGLYKRQPVVVAPFDTELFGHWWFEGPEFLYHFLKKTALYSEVIDTVSLPEYIDKFPLMQVTEPAVSTWGDGGYFKVWLNEKTEWIYPHLNVMGKRMIEVASKFVTPSELQRRILNQMARELLLAESSDWAFLISVGTAVDYATTRQEFHINAFNYLYESLQSGIVNKSMLEHLEVKDSIFPEIEYVIFKEER